MEVVAEKLKPQRVHITECLTHLTNSGETAPNSAWVPCSSKSGGKNSHRQNQTFRAGFLSVAHAQGPLGSRRASACLFRVDYKSQLAGTRCRLVTRASRSALGRLLRAPAHWRSLRRRIYNAWAERAGCRSLSLMQEPSAVVEVSAGAVLKPGPGADPSEFRPCRAHSSRSHVRGRGEGLRLALCLGTKAVSQTHPSMGDWACGLAAGRRHVGQPGLGDPER